MDLLEEARVEAHVFADDGSIPNNCLPLLVYRGALRLPAADAAAAFERAFAACGWDRSWRNGIYSFPHYHSTAHEVLGIACGQARVRFGGAQGLVARVCCGDAVLIPAGVGHQNLGASADLLVVGAYPPGPDWDLCRGEPGERPRVLEHIACVPLPARDPLYGSSGPLSTHWSERKAR